MSAPTYAGQAVRNNLTGNIGITTSAPMARSPRIGVIYLSAPYDISEWIEHLEVIEIAEVSR